MKKAAFLLFLINTLLACKKDDDISPLQDNTDTKLQQLYEDSELSGFSVAVMNNNNVTYLNSFGHANIEENKEFTSSTIQNIGSISKTLIAIAVMKAVEQGKLDLDANINTYLPFKVIHPYHPEKPITVRHLATHTSGILDDEVYIKSYVLENPTSVNVSDFPEDYQPIMEFVKMNTYIDESKFLENVLSIDSDWYTEDSFSEYPPGTMYEYSNIAATLAAFVVESATKISYEEYTRTHILEPLQMNESGWSFDEVNMNKHATLYYTKDFEVPRYSLITKADGGLLTNMTDLSRFLIEMIKGQKGEGTLLTPESYTEMFSYQVENGITGAEGGIFWEIDDSEILHSGGDPGILTYAVFNTERNRGQLLITNISEDFDEGISESFEKIWDTLHEIEF